MDSKRLNLGGESALLSWFDTATVATIVVAIRVLKAERTFSAIVQSELVGSLVVTRLASLIRCATIQWYKRGMRRAVW